MAKFILIIISIFGFCRFCYAELSVDYDFASRNLYVYTDTLYENYRVNIDIISYEGNDKVISAFKEVEITYQEENPIIIPLQQGFYNVTLYKNTVFYTKKEIFISLITNNIQLYWYADYTDNITYDILYKKTLEEAYGVDFVTVKDITTCVLDNLPIKQKLFVIIRSTGSGGFEYGPSNELIMFTGAPPIPVALRIE